MLQVSRRINNSLYRMLLFVPKSQTAAVLDQNSGTKSLISVHLYPDFKHYAKLDHTWHMMLTWPIRNPVIVTVSRFVMDKQCSFRMFILRNLFQSVCFFLLIDERCYCLYKTTAIKYKFSPHKCNLIKFLCLYSYKRIK